MRRIHTKGILVVVLVLLIPVAVYSIVDYWRYQTTAAVLEAAGEHFCCGHFDKGIADLNQLLKRDPDCLEARYMLSDAYGLLDNRPEQENQLKLAAAQVPGAPRTYYELGQFYLIEKRLPEGIKSLQRCLKLDANHLSAKEMLARMYELTGQMDDAKKTWKELHRQEPDSLIVQRALQRIERKPHK